MNAPRALSPMKGQSDMNELIYKLGEIKEALEELEIASMNKKQDVDMVKINERLEMIQEAILKLQKETENSRCEITLCSIL